MIIRHTGIPNTMPPQQDQVFAEWFNGLDAAVGAMVQPVDIPAPVPAVQHAFIIWRTDVPDELLWETHTLGWLPANLADFPAVAGDVTSVNPSGTPQAFALSLADVVRLTTPEGPFTNLGTRTAKGFGEAHGAGWWWLRTPGVSSYSSWNVQGGLLTGGSPVNAADHPSNLRPAIIIHQ